LHQNIKLISVGYQSYFCRFVYFDLTYGGFNSPHLNSEDYND